MRGLTLETEHGVLGNERMRIEQDNARKVDCGYDGRSTWFNPPKVGIFDSSPASSAYCQYTPCPQLKYPFARSVSALSNANSELMSVKAMEMLDDRRVKVVRPLIP